MIMLEKALRATDQNPALDDPDISYAKQRQAYGTVVRPVGWFRYWWVSFKNCIVQDVPEELAFCEFECRDPSCLQGGCKNPQKPAINNISHDN